MISVASASSLVVVTIWSWFYVGASFNLVAAALGVAGGLGLFFAIFTYFRLIQSGARLGVSWTIVTLSMTIPTGASILIWKEFPSFSQWLALALAVCGIFLLGRVKAGGLRLSATEAGLLAVAFFMSGAVGLTLKVIAAQGLEGYKGIYFLSLWSSCLLAGATGCALSRRAPGRTELVIGGVMGLAGVGNIVFLLLALGLVTGTVAFPLKTCGSLLLTVAASYLLWREQISRREFLGLLCALAAIVLMNL